MSGLLGLLRGLAGGGVAESDVRAEAWALGARHLGRVVEGARAELAVQGISARRASLLRAVIRSRQRTGGDHDR